MKEEKQEYITRRQATKRLFKIVAMAAGLGLGGAKLLFAAGKTKLNKSKLAVVKAKNQSIKILKVILQPERRVFESEFRRVTPKYKVQNVKNIPANYRDIIKGAGINDIQPGMMICPVEFMGGNMNAACADALACGVNFNNIGGFKTGYECDNYCAVDGCSGTLICMGKYDCGSVSCGTKLTSNSASFTPGFFNQYQNDPYVQALFSEFSVKTSQQLSQEVQSFIETQRQNLIK